MVSHFITVSVSQAKKTESKKRWLAERLCYVYNSSVKITWMDGWMDGCLHNSKHVSNLSLTLCVCFMDKIANMNVYCKEVYSSTVQVYIC